MNEFTFTGQGFSDYLYWQKQDKKTLKKINSLLEDIRRNGAMQGIGKPEPLKYRPDIMRNNLNNHTSWNFSPGGMVIEKICFNFVKYMPDLLNNPRKSC